MSPDANDGKLSARPISKMVEPNLKGKEYIQAYGTRAILPGKTEAAVHRRTDQK